MAFWQLDETYIKVKEGLISVHNDRINDLLATMEEVESF